jgi:SpoVK/Ycf46/Vps4 family AAA+-type ATPase
MAQQESTEEVAVRSNIARDIIRKHRFTPMALYRIKDLYVDVTTNPNFIDALLVLASFIAFAAAFPFYPFIILAALCIVLFIGTLKHSFLGLILLMVMTFPMLMYQTPALAYVFLLIMVGALVYGYRHYRTMIFALILVPLALSTLGYLFAIPALILGALIVGYKRAGVLSIIFVIGVVMLSAATGVQNSAYISYNAQIAHTKVSGSPALNYSVPNKPQLNLLTLPTGISVIGKNIGNIDVVAYMYSEFGAFFEALTVQPLQWIIDLIGFAVVVVFIDAVAVGSRSFYKGTEACLVGIVYPLLYFALSFAFKNPFNYIPPLWSFIIAVAFVYIIELYRVDIVKALEVRKEDIRLKFGEAFEDLLASSPSEKFSDIGNYESTKVELKEAIVSPIEDKALSRAYNIKPVRGVLLFGPPGTGKTMLMRAIANDIRAGFFLVKAPNLVSALPGDTERRLSSIFATARKNAPCILFFDEIDSIARSRSQGGSDEVHRQILTQLLIEMDGFQRLKSVVVVGATNAPDILDPAILRPGRFDRAIYMPLPDFNGRKEIFKIYLSKLPISKDVKIDELAKLTERFSGADINAVCNDVAKEVAQVAAKKHVVLEITQQDIKNFIQAVRPSTKLSQLKDYDRFKVDFERRTLGQEKVEKAETTGMKSIVGLEDAKKAIVDAVKVPMEHPELVKKYNVKSVKGILMFGPPGGGKTMFMRAVSNELKGVTMLEINGADISQKDVVSATSEIKSIFNRAIENSPSILFIDEIDGIAPNRRSASEEGVQLTSQFLQEMDGLREATGVVLVCATNRPSALDPAILRPGRFDKLIFVQPPNEAEREQLFKNYVEGVPLSKDIDFGKLAKETEGYTGADIANVCREAKQTALNVSIGSGKEEEITMEVLAELVKRFKASAPQKVVDSYKSFLERYGQR